VRCPFLAPQGPDRTAQGNALGRLKRHARCPEGAKPDCIRCVALSGLLPLLVRYPGRCPGLKCCAPSGQRRSNLCRATREVSRRTFHPGRDFCRCLRRRSSSACDPGDGHADRAALKRPAGGTFSPASGRSTSRHAPPSRTRPSRSATSHGCADPKEILRGHPRIRAMIDSTFTPHPALLDKPAVAPTTSLRRCGRCGSRSRSR
jgi:hypothetical protein